MSTPFTLTPVGVAVKYGGPSVCDDKHRRNLRELVLIAREVTLEGV